LPRLTESRVPPTRGRHHGASCSAKRILQRGAVSALGGIPILLCHAHIAESDQRGRGHEHQIDVLAELSGLEKDLVRSLVAHW